MEPIAATLTGPEATQFYTVQWKPVEEPLCTVVFVHGFVEHVRRYDHMFRYFAENGIAVFAFDQRGFGATAAATKTPGVTSWPQQFADITWAIDHAATLHPGTPLILLGHSMGGALSCAYATRTPPSPSVNKLTAVVASSPLIRQTPAVKASALVVRAGSLVGKISSKLTIKAPVPPEDVCRDPEVQKIYASDPLCAPTGTLRGVSDMLLGGEALVSKDFKNWPAQLPLFVVHGTGDKVTDHDASKEFVEKIKAAGKPAEFRSFEGFYHEMHNEPGEDRWTEIRALEEWIKRTANSSRSAKL